MNVRARLVNWIVLLIVVAGLAPWAPAAMAQDGTPDGGEAVEVIVNEVDAETPTSEPVATESQSLAPNSLQEESDESLPGAVTVVGITLQCTVATDQVAGTLTVTDPAGAESVNLTLKTTDNPAIADLQSIAVPVTPGSTSYAFVAVLEPGDYEASTTHEAVVVGPNGVPASLPFDLGLVNGLTVCQPEGVEPSVTETITATETATSTETATATETISPTVSVITTGKVINTAGANLNCRSAASSTASIISKLAPSASVPVRGAAINGWVPVTCGGLDGFVSASYLQITTAPGTVVPTATSTVTPAATSTPGEGVQSATIVNTGGAGLRCRTAANTSATIITVLPEGSSVAVRGAASNGWVPVTCGGRDGFISASYARVSSGTSTTPTATASSTATSTSTTGTPSTGQTAYVTGTGGAGLRCRTTPETGAVITVLPENSQVSIETQSNGWARIQCAGQTGWVSMTYVLFTVNPGSGGGELRIDVNLRTQYMIVYQGTNVLGRSYVSTGRPGFDTPTGTYYINRKVLVKDMAGVLGGESYHVKDVPHVMYFTNRGHAIHGTYWHNNFGYVMSHGCVNLPQGFASWLYGITPIGTKMTIHF